MEKNTFLSILKIFLFNKSRARNSNNIKPRRKQKNKQLSEYEVRHNFKRAIKTTKLDRKKRKEKKTRDKKIE